MADGDPLSIGLTPLEQRVLRAGLIEWQGPASSTEELAVAMGFRSVGDLFADTDRLIDAIEANAPMTRLDWARVLLATEVAFISDVVGSGSEWSITTGISDSETLTALRGIQQRLVQKGLRRVVGHGFGTLPER